MRSLRACRAKVGLGIALSVSLCLGAVATAHAATNEGIHKIQHVIMIMQENRSFDSYFGTYPGAHGIPGGVCVPDPKYGGCVQPFHNSIDRNSGGPHTNRAAVADIGTGQYIEQAENARAAPCKTEATCHEVMGYHDAREIPNYWKYAEQFVLQDNLYTSSRSWSLIEHNYLVSGWSAVCSDSTFDPMECKGNTEASYKPRNWTDITYLLAKAGMSWRYYIYEGAEPDCESDEVATCEPRSKPGPQTLSIWNPLAGFSDVKEDGQLGNIQSLTNFYSAVHEQSCGLPNVAWIIPNDSVSEHPPARISRGQAYVTTLVNSIMRSPCWGSTAIFISWDDWGGFYDHVAPPNIDEDGYGLRVPGLVISPYAKSGYIDHQQLSHDAYLKFIEDDFLNSARLNPATDGRPDSRPNVREEAAGLGDLANDFDFTQSPLPALLLSPHPEPGPASEPPGSNTPSVELVTPSAGPESGGTAVTITGTNLSAATSVEFGSTDTTSFTVGSDTSITAVSPPGAGSVDVVVATPGGTSPKRPVDRFSYAAPPTVTEVAPSDGPVSGGTAVTISGTNLTEATGVTFGSTAAAGFTVASTTSINAVSPAESAGAVQVSVATPGGASAGSSDNRFRFGPTITGLTPKAGSRAGGSSVSVRGTGFGLGTRATSFRFGSSRAASVECSSTTTCTVITPAHEAGTVDVKAIVKQVEARKTPADQFTFN
jgi:phospholipase C